MSKFIVSSIEFKGRIIEPVDMNLFSSIDESKITGGRAKNCSKEESFKLNKKKDKILYKYAPELKLTLTDAKWHPAITEYATSNDFKQEKSVAEIVQEWEERNI